MRACIVVLGVLVACEPEKSTSARELAPRPVAGPKKRAPTEAKKKQQKWHGSRWDAPTDLPHLASTGQELRRKIDGLVATMLDVKAGWSALRARDELVTLGKPAFLRVLAAMARIRDTIHDDDTEEERRIERSLQRADECLRGMDGYLDMKAKQPIRPGTDRNYIVYIVRLHYKRWTLRLQYMPELPGPYDPATWDPGKEVLALLECWLGGDTGVRAAGGRRTASHAKAVALEALFDADQYTIGKLPPRAWALIDDLPARMKKERESRAQLGPHLLRGLDHRNARLRTVAGACLRALYDTIVGYDPNASLAHRFERIRRWRGVIDAASE